MKNYLITITGGKNLRLQIQTLADDFAEASVNAGKILDQVESMTNGIICDLQIDSVVCFTPAAS